MDDKYLARKIARLERLIAAAELRLERMWELAGQRRGIRFDADLQHTIEEFRRYLAELQEARTDALVALGGGPSLRQAIAQESDHTREMIIGSWTSS